MNRLLLAALGALLLSQGSSVAATITIVKGQTDNNPFPNATARLKTTGTNRLNPGTPQQVWSSTSAPGTATGPTIENNNYNPSTFIWSYSFTNALAFTTTFLTPAAPLGSLTIAELDLNALLTAFHLEVISMMCGQNANQACVANNTIDPYSFYASNALLGPVTITSGSTSTQINPAAYGGLPLQNLDLLALGFKAALEAGNNLSIAWALSATYYADFRQYATDCKNCVTTFNVRAANNSSSGYVARLTLSDSPIPEPSTNLLMGAGLGLIGLALARRKKTA